MTLQPHGAMLKSQWLDQRYHKNGDFADLKSEKKKEKIRGFVPYFLTFSSFSVVCATLFFDLFL